ncbi:helix-turn-helix domain-containing protein [Roseospira visakhapatnamensis]|uniref:helix-turn-helix domain-containing protein n=1 Tax=Roseospira visakhapatnamensis TaxID=390880 RepID=UPI0016078D59
MQLRAWRLANGLTVAEFALRVRRSIHAIRKYENGTRIPDRDTMAAIHRATAGAVTPNDFYGVELSQCGAEDTRTGEREVRHATS